MVSITLAALALLAVNGSGVDAAATQPSKPVTGFIYKTVSVGETEYAYCVFVPPTYDPAKPTPVILFLHGSGECGNDGFRQTDVGIGRALRKNHRRVPAIVVMPQCQIKDVWWSRQMTLLVARCMQATDDEYNIDHSRAYLTGLSLGGAGCWHIAAVMPGQFAAVAPLCGLSDKKMGYKVSLAPKLTGMPIWAFHGALDDRVPVSETRDMVRAIREAGGDCKYTELTGGTHFIWDTVYEDKKFWAWLFAQKMELISEAPE